MPITVTCGCGKVFKVRDGLAGEVAICQVCGRSIPVTIDANEQVVPVAQPMAVSAPMVGHDDDMRQCSACAEPVPADALHCPMCGESLAHNLDAARAREMLEAQIQSLEEHLENRGAAADDQLRGSTLTARTIVVGIITLVSAIMVAIGAAMPGDSGVGFIVIGIFLGIGFAIGFLVSMSNDKATSHIHDARSADKAYKNYFKAIRTRRANRAFAALTPTARKAGVVETIEFDKIPTNPGSYLIADPDSFRKYWQSVLAGPSLQARGCLLKKVRLVGTSEDDVAVVEAEFQFTNYASLLALLILINLIVCAIVIAICTKRETKVIRKVLVRRRGRWYVVEGEFQGILDKVEVG